jgi:DNA polymerase-4
MEGIAGNVGPALRASIGLAPTRLLAKLAAERVKPDGLTVLSIEDLPHCLEDIPLTDIPGVGAGVATRLARAGVDDFLGLWNLEPKQARAVWGSVMGERFWYGLHGFETVEEPTKKSMIGHSRVLAREHEPPAKARIVARALLLKAASRLRHYDLFANTLSLSIRLRPDGGWQSARQFRHTKDSYLFLKMLDELWNEFLRQRRREGGSGRIGGVTVYLHGLAKPGDGVINQLDLFDAPLRKIEDGRRADLWKAIDTINSDPEAKFRRLGAATASGEHKRHIALASQSGLALNYLGAKIAFSRVPEEAEFLY